MLAIDPSLPLAARIDQLTLQLRAIRDPQQRFAACVEHARHRPMLPDAHRLESNRVEGCLVRIWFVPSFRDGRCWFELDSDAVTLKALAGLLCELYSGCLPADVAAHPPRFLDELNLAQHLAENRRRTVWRVRDKIREFAEAHGAGPGPAPTDANPAP